MSRLLPYPSQSLPLQLYPVLDFVAEMSELRRPHPNTDNNPFVYRLSFTKEELPQLTVADTDHGLLLVGSKQRTLLAAHYMQVILGITMLIALKFEVHHLIFVEDQDLSGVSFSFSTPSHKLMTHRYVRQPESQDIIPQDFLADLSKFPTIYF